MYYESAGYRMAVHCSQGETRQVDDSCIPDGSVRLNLRLRRLIKTDALLMFSIYKGYKQYLPIYLATTIFITADAPG